MFVYKYYITRQLQKVANILQTGDETKRTLQKTCLCSTGIQRFLEVVKNEKFQLNFFANFSYFCCKHRLWVHVRTASAHNLCFEAKIRKIGIPLHTPVLLYKSVV